MVVKGGKGNRQSGTLIFLHINKTAGTSLRKTLENNYRNDERVFIYPGDSRFLTLEQFAEIPRGKKKEIRLIMGHIGFGLHESMPAPCRYVTMLRDPVDRVLSTYYHHESKPGAELYTAIHEHGWGVADYLDQGFPEFDNWMTRRISGTTKSLWSLDENDLCHAQENIKAYFDFVLLQERYEEGIKMLADHYRWDSDETYMVNMSRGRRPKSEHSDDVLRRIEEINQYDRALYDFVTSNYEALNRKS